MEGFIICPICKFWKDHLIQSNCCTAKYCESCIENFKAEQTKCPRCKKQLVFKEEKNTFLLLFYLIQYWLNVNMKDVPL